MPNLPSRLPHYPYCMLRTYLCGHPPEIIEVSKNNSRTVHFLLDALPRNLGHKPLTFSLARCKVCAEGLRLKQSLEDVIKSQGNASMERVFKEADRDKNGFRDVLWRYKNSSDRNHHVVLMDGYQHHDRVPEELNRDDERIFDSWSMFDPERHQQPRSYQRALRLRQGKELPEVQQEGWDSRQREDVNSGSDYGRANAEALNANTGQSYRHVKQTSPRDEWTQHVRHAETPRGREKIDELDRVHEERKEADVGNIFKSAGSINVQRGYAGEGSSYQSRSEQYKRRPKEYRRSFEHSERDLDELYENTGAWREKKLKVDRDQRDHHESLVRSYEATREEPGQWGGRIVQGLSDLLAPELQIKGSNWNKTKIAHWNDSATGIPEDDKDFDPANDSAIGVNDSLSMVASPNRAQRESIDSLQSSLSKSDRTSESLRSRKTLRFSDDILERERQKESYPSIPRPKGRVQALASEGKMHKESKPSHLALTDPSVTETERLKAEKLNLEERMARLGQMGAVPRSPKSPHRRSSKELKRTTSLPSAGLNLTDVELEKAKRWNLEEKLASIGQMGAPVRSLGNSKKPGRSDSMQSKGSKSSTESGSKLNLMRRNTIGGSLSWFKWKSKDKNKGKGIAEEEDDDKE
ncbi:hypothetical protein BDV96DRAFT_573079 [Lophiotrema nucula]|uniref:Uncharacterized protein n=1 Tax=Lophiotrema nucula TaxID=690887 RepID=A0A6A5ZCH1_9PLEO|nr:hypothetical protein BDV96DRAFT_573079 [Lophiotrema nucula]